jgi:hypothetical protein
MPFYAWPTYPGNTADNAFRKEDRDPNGKQQGGPADYYHLQVGAVSAALDSTIAASAAFFDSAIAASISAIILLSFAFQLPIWYRRLPCL